jgi:ABC-2 type transport system permease protein
VKALTYACYELIRTFRSRRFFIFSFGFPLALYYAIAAPNRNEHNLGGSGIAAQVYFMVGLAGFGTMNAVLATGARIAAERAVGWNRQLRLTPLSTRTYFSVKVLTAYAMALLANRTSVRGRGNARGAPEGLELAGHDRADSGRSRPVRGPRDPDGPPVDDRLDRARDGWDDGAARAPGWVWFPITGGVMQRIAEALPSYWLVQASHVGLGGGGWGTTGWAVVAAWSVGAALAAGRAYRRDTQRA